ncbi:hypothetical protein [Streptomyces sindenensis]|uniref:Uncharacterized protein n=1 Tax=Streptomyces sindenensis TaxID=67363 RepID=A0ABW6EH16_9ACTN
MIDPLKMEGVDISSELSPWPFKVDIDPGFNDAPGRRDGHTCRDPQLADVRITLREESEAMSFFSVAAPV